MARFNILSSCICRDGFGFREDNKHEIGTFLQSTSPLIWFVYNDKPHKTIDYSDFDDTKLNQFRKKCIINDYNKSVLCSYTQKADFFITDLVTLASTNICKIVFDDGHENYFTHSKWFKDAYDQNLKNVLNGSIKIINRLKILNDSLIEEIIDQYVDWIKSCGYREQEVILVENMKALCYSEGELLYYFENQNSRNDVNIILEKIYRYFEEKMPNCYKIKMPHNVYSDVNHKWGLTDLHYCKEYYDYLYESYDLITEGKEQKEIDILREKYSKILQKKRDAFAMNAFSYMRLNQQELLSGTIGRVSSCDKIAPAGVMGVCKKKRNKSIILTKCYVAKFYDINYSLVNVDGEEYLVNNDDCLYGYIGNGKNIGGDWTSVNSSTLVYEKENAIVIGHDYSKSKAQTQVIKTIDEFMDFSERDVVLTVWARCLALNDQKEGGVIGIINDVGYNKGQFYAKKKFTNREWEKIELKVKLPSKESFKGLTICLRALAGTNNENVHHAQVEFSEPKLITMTPEGEKNPKRRR